MNRSRLPTVCHDAATRRRLSQGMPAAVAAVAIVALLVGGCGKRAPQATVEGMLRMNGKPLDNCLITFLPVVDNGPPGPHSSAVSDHEGHYQLRLTTSNWARPSDHTVSWFRTSRYRTACGAWTTAPLRSSRAALRRPSARRGLPSATRRSANRPSAAT